jgi:hypothetical protein
MNRNKKRDEAYGGFILTFEPARCTKIDTALRYHRREATETFSASDWKFLPRELVLVSLDMDEFDDRDRRTINGAALMERTKVGGATGKLKMRLHSPVMFDKPIDISELPVEFRARARYSTSVNLKRLGPHIWRDLLARIKGLRPESSDDIALLETQQFEDRRIFPLDVRTERLMEQRDAIGIAVDIAGLDRSTILETLDTSRIEQADSMLDLLDSEPLQEQDAIRQDQIAFGNLLAPGMRHAQFANRGGAQVRVHVYDRKPLETVIGIDLLIYMSLYQAYILLQYKMMERSDQIPGKWSYRIDQHLLKQLTAMNRVAARFGSAANPVPMANWRLSEETFFWRFCESTRLSDAEGSLVHGITLGRAHLDSFLNLPQTTQFGGASRIGYGNCHRYLSTSQFVELAKAGWIGGGVGATAFIEKLLQANQRGGRQTLLAFISQAEQLDRVNRGWRQ